MTIPFKSQGQHQCYRNVIVALRDLGYSGELLREEYTFGDWFERTVPLRTIAAAAFGQTPVSYNTALFGVAPNNGVSGTELVSLFRSLGAPVFFEVHDDRVSQWKVGIDQSTTEIVREIDATQIRDAFDDQRDEWSPHSFLRTKNIESARFEYQPTLFAGLIPELEQHIQDVLGPLISAAFKSAAVTYSASGRKPPEEQLFRLAFWMLTGKVFYDRGHDEFCDLNSDPDPDDVLRRVADHYGESIPRLLNRESREAVARHVWSKMDFRNLSVDVLAQIWSTTLVTKKTRRQLGIHRTRKSLVEYIVGHIPFQDIPKSERIVLEPCSGSATFLVAALNRLRGLPDTQADPRIRNGYFQKMLRGIEREPFGIEISKLCLALADYPNASGWRIDSGDVFNRDVLRQHASDARVVLCNPPFEDFSDDERSLYRTRTHARPAELLSRMLDVMHHEAVLGFVLPRTFVDGRSYRDVRERLARRYRDVHILSLPDKGWEHASKETIALIATEPRDGRTTSLTYRTVREPDWRMFDWYHEVRSEDALDVFPSEAADRLFIPELREVWEYLRYCTTLGEVSEIHRGIEWNKPLTQHSRETGWREKLVRARRFKDSKLGVAPRTSYHIFERPTLWYLDFSDEHRRGNAHNFPWSEPKVIVNSLTHSRGPWRLASFVDRDSGLACYQTYTAVWPHETKHLEAIAAILNGPVGNAFAATHEDKSHIRVSTLESIPFPILTDSQIEDINEHAMKYVTAATGGGPDALEALVALDAVTLSAYGLPPKLERQLLDYFRGWERKTIPFADFPDYFPRDFEPWISLRDWTTGRHSEATVDRFRQQSPEVPEHIMESLRIAGAPDEGDE